MAKVNAVTPIEIMHGNMIKFWGRMDSTDKIKPLDPKSSIKKPTVNPRINPLKKIIPSINGMPTTERPSSINKTAVFMLLESDM